MAEFLLDNGSNHKLASEVLGKSEKVQWLLDTVSKIELAKNLKAALDKPLTKAQQLSNDIEGEDFSYKPSTNKTTRTKL